MGMIDIIAKWSLEKNSWNFNPEQSQHGRSFAFANYERIINNNGGINYIIFAFGSRVEDHSKNYISIKESEAKISQVLSQYSKKNDNYDIKLHLMDADAPIIEDARLFAAYIDELAGAPNTKSINIVGLSKCSTMSFYVPSFFKNELSFKKTNLFNIAAPYEGTKLASPFIFYPAIEELISSKINNDFLANKISSKLISFYESISSNSHMDYDIAVIGGVGEDKKHVYDENFIKNVFCNKNVDSIKRLRTFKNFVTGIDKDTFKEAFFTGNFVGMGLCILDDLFFDNSSDGLIYTSSQKLVGKYIGSESIILPSSHHDVFGIPRIRDKILACVTETLEEANEFDNTRKYTKISR